MFCVLVCLCVCLFFGEQIFIKKILWEGPGQRKKLHILGKVLDHFLDKKA